MVKNIFLFALLMGGGTLISGCTMVTPLMSEAQSVRIVLKEPQGCEILGEVEGYKYNTWMDLSLKEMKTSARNDLKNNAYAMGADTVFIISRDSVSGSSTAFVYGMAISESQANEYHIEGIAYICE